MRVRHGQSLGWITRPSTLAYPTPLSLPRECPVVSANGKNYLYHRNKGEGRSVPTTIIGYRSSNCFHFVVRSWPPGRVTRRSSPPPKVPQSVVCDIVLIQMKKQVQTEKWQGMPLEEAPHLSPVAQYPHAKLRGEAPTYPRLRIARLLQRALLAPLLPILRVMEQTVNGDSSHPLFLGQTIDFGTIALI